MKITEPTHRTLIKLLILEENFKRHLETFASELFICTVNLNLKSTFYMTHVKDSNALSSMSSKHHWQQLPFSVFEISLLC